MFKVNFLENETAEEKILFHVFDVFFYVKSESIV